MFGDGQAAIHGKRRLRRQPDWDNKARRWLGDLYELCPDKLLDVLNGDRDQTKITALPRKYRSQRR
ncbi:hypothetical protein GCM10027614_78430 [Micromonospora vulcania]